MGEDGIDFENENVQRIVDALAEEFEKTTKQQKIRDLITKHRDTNDDKQDDYDGQIRDTTRKLTYNWKWSNTATGTTMVSNTAGTTITTGTTSTLIPDYHYESGDDPLEELEADFDQIIDNRFKDLQG